MKKENRLLKNQDFKSVLDFKKCVSRETAAFYHKNNDLQHCRVGVSVSSKIGNSVVRHRIKRQVNSMLDKYVPVDEDGLVIGGNKVLTGRHTIDGEFTFELYEADWAVSIFSVIASAQRFYSKS